MWKRWLLILVLLLIILVSGCIEFRDIGAGKSLEECNILKKQYEELANDYNRLWDEYNSLLNKYSALKMDLGFAKLPPYVVIENRTVNIIFKTSKGGLHVWSVPIETLELTIIRGYYERKNLQYKILKNEKMGEFYRVVDVSRFIDDRSFSKVMPELYKELNSDEAFIQEVWYIATQLTVYHPELEEIPRFPIETLIGGGGDCEDIAILIASMLKAAQANYIVKIVYMDSENPSEPKKVNHAIVWVETPSGYKTFVDGTCKESISPFTEVSGWYLEV
ncbi:MAG: hypothetical protein QXF37_07415 [Archaeoglobaceae archaeon]